MSTIGREILTNCERTFTSHLILDTLIALHIARKWNVEVDHVVSYAKLLGVWVIL